MRGGAGIGNDERVHHAAAARVHHVDGPVARWPRVGMPLGERSHVKPVMRSLRRHAIGRAHLLDRCQIAILGRRRRPRRGTRKRDHCRCLGWNEGLGLAAERVHRCPAVAGPADEARREQVEIHPGRAAHLRPLHRHIHRRRRHRRDRSHQRRGIRTRHHAHDPGDIAGRQGRGIDFIAEHRTCQGTAGGHDIQPVARRRHRRARSRLVEQTDRHAVHSRIHAALPRAVPVGVFEHAHHRQLAPRELQPHPVHRPRGAARDVLHRHGPQSAAAQAVEGVQRIRRCRRAIIERTRHGVVGRIVQRVGRGTVQLHVVVVVGVAGSLNQRHRRAPGRCQQYPHLSAGRVRDVHPDVQIADREPVGHRHGPHHLAGHGSRCIRNRPACAVFVNPRLCGGSHRQHHQQACRTPPETAILHSEWVGLHALKYENYTFL